MTYPLPAYRGNSGNVTSDMRRWAAAVRKPKSLPVMAGLDPATHRARVCERKKVFPKHGHASDGWPD
jgi:hypothetical protein